MCWWNLLASALLCSAVNVANSPNTRAPLLEDQHPGLLVRFAEDGRLTEVCGAAMSAGESPLASAASFIRSHAARLGVPAAELQPGDRSTGLATLPLMYEPADDAYQFTLVGFHQVRSGFPVFRSGVRLLTRRTNGFPVVWVSSSVPVTPPGPADILHPSEPNEHYRAAINAYLHANLARDYILKYHPTYPTLSTQTGFVVSVNIDSSCGANYNGSSISFFRAKGSCNNTGFGAAVHHEYGHHLVAMGGSGQGQYGEGMSDTLSMLITDDPGFAYGFYAQRCDLPIRHPVVTPRFYPCAGSIFDCGMLLSGGVWETRLRLQENFPNTYRDVLGRLVINAVPLHRGTQIDPNIAIHYLVLDDDDQNLANGTPHSLEICGAFATRNMTGGTPCQTMRHIRIADSNCDGKRNFGDINPFVLALSDLNAYQRKFPDCYIENSDCNKDGALDFGDIEKFVEAITATY